MKRRSNLGYIMALSALFTALERLSDQIQESLIQFELNAVTVILILFVLLVISMNAPKMRRRMRS